MPTTFKQHIIDLAPPWLRGAHPQGEAWLRGLGDIKDLILDRLKASVRIRFPRYASRDALAIQGAERLTYRSPTDTDDTYAARIEGAWDTWPWAGTAFGVLSALRHAGYSNIPKILIAKQLVYGLDSNFELTISTAPSGSFTFDPPNHWATLVVYFPTKPAAWGGVTPANGSNEALFVLHLIDIWKSAHARLQSVVIAETGLTWGYPTTLAWGGAGLVWGGTTTVWTP
jgi:hypothetical protein